MQPFFLRISAKIKHSLTAQCPNSLLLVDLLDSELDIRSRLRNYFVSRLYRNLNFGSIIGYTLTRDSQILTGAFHMTQ